MDGTPFQYRLLIREGHLDTFGHVNNAAYLQILEEARWELITTNGYGLEQVRALQLGPVILEIRIKFKRELRLREEITVQTRCTEYRRKIGRMEQRIFNARGELCCEAELTFGLFDTAKRKLVAPTEKWLKAMGVPSPVTV